MKLSILAFIYYTITCDHFDLLKIVNLSFKIYTLFQKNAILLIYYIFPNFCMSLDFYIVLGTYSAGIVSPVGEVDYWHQRQQVDSEAHSTSDKLYYWPRQTWQTDCERRHCVWLHVRCSCPYRRNHGQKVLFGYPYRNLPAYQPSTPLSEEKSYFKVS